MYTRAVVTVSQLSFCAFRRYLGRRGRCSAPLCPAASQDSQHHHLQHARKERCSAGPSSCTEQTKR